MLQRLFFLTLICLPACQSTGTGTATSSTQAKYELTLAASIDGTDFQGFALGGPGPTHQITIKSADNVSYFIGQTCHRFDKHEDVVSQGWIAKRKSWTYNYTFAPTIEDTGDCPLRICQYSKTVGTPAVQCGLIDFKNPKYSLPFENICNGLDGQTTGKAVCHNKVGLVQRVRFKEPVVVADPLPTPDGQDPSLTFLIPNQCSGQFIDQAQTTWQYTVPKTECYVIFAQMAKPHARAKLTVVPYDLPLYTGSQQ